MGNITLSKFTSSSAINITTDKKVSVTTSSLIKVPVISKTSKTDEDKYLKDGEEISDSSGYDPDLDYERNFLSIPKFDGKIKAESIVSGLLLNGFATAREIAIQTYTRKWFDQEEDLRFKIDLANELSRIFGKDGYKNTVWNTIAGKL